jgi:hypothetical protein
MSIGGISASSLFNLNTGSLQSTQQAQQQSFQTLAQQLQASEFNATQQNGAVPRINSPNPSSINGGSTNASTSGTSAAQDTRAHFHHRFRVRIDSGSENPDDSPNQEQPLQSTTASTAQAAYNSLSQDLQQVALNSDLITAQSAMLQSTSVSLTA